MTMQYQGAYLYALPLYFIVPIGTSLLVYYLSVRFFARSRANYFKHLIFLHFCYLCLAFVAAGLIAVLDDLVTATMFLVAVVFYGVLNVIPVAILIEVWFIGKVPVKRVFKAALLAYSLALLAVSAYSQFVEPYWMEVTESTVNLPSAPELKVVHLSDPQSEYFSKREKEAVELINDLKPDLILITGDYYTGTRHHQKAGLKAARYLLERLKARYGTFAIPGSSNAPEDHHALFEGVPVKYLENEGVVLEIDGKKMAIVGLSYFDPDLEKASRNVPPDLPTILLYHSPEIAFNSEGGPKEWKEMMPRFFTRRSINRGISDHGVDLVLVGHTHGGQVCLPLVGPLVSGTKYGRRYASGWFDFEGFLMYVNRGLGMDGRFGPKIRFLCRPEIAVINIVDKK